MSTATISAFPGNADTALADHRGSEGRPLHLAHLQFYGYGKEGDRGFSSAARAAGRGGQRRKPNVTVDVGQVMFGQTVTVSSDVLRQFNARDRRGRRNGVIIDGDGNGGGIVPYLYREATSTTPCNGPSGSSCSC